MFFLLRTTREKNQCAMKLPCGQKKLSKYSLVVSTAQSGKHFKILNNLDKLTLTASSYIIFCENHIFPLQNDYSTN